MAINLIHVSDIHFGSGESHGRINPATGLNVRFEDFAAALTRTVDYTIANHIDVFLFSGDAYKNASPEPVYQKTFAVQLKRLSDASIPVILLPGNHDQILKSSSSHAMSVFESLAVPGLTVIDYPRSLKLETSGGPLQIIAIPHVTRHLLMTHDKYAAMGATELDRTLVRLVKEMLADFYSELDSSIPTVVTAHAMLDRARAGAEEELLAGYTMTFPTELFIDERVDYVALGHVHKYQILRDARPTIAYAGSIERVDFSEEHEDKGFVHVRISRGEVKLQFHSIAPRRFITLEADLTASENPTDELCELLSKSGLEGAVVRLKYKLQHDRLHQVDEDILRKTASSALSLRLKPELITSERPRRMPELDEHYAGNPAVALEKYLSEAYPEHKDELMKRTRELMAKLEARE
jgi:DNA repair protein SbcD/Mre11